MKSFILRINLLVLLSFSTSSFGACFCVCSVFHTLGGEIKLCPKEPQGEQCDDWRHPVDSAQDSRSCFNLGETTNDCKGYKKSEVAKKTKWIETYGGRYHTCRFVESKKK